MYISWCPVSRRFTNGEDVWKTHLSEEILSQFVRIYFLTTWQIFVSYNNNTMLLFLYSLRNFHWSPQRIIPSNSSELQSEGQLMNQKSDVSVGKIYCPLWEPSLVYVDRCACKAGRAFVKLQEDSAVLHLGAEPTDLSLSLSKLKDSEGRTEVKELLFKMADSLQHLESQGKQRYFHFILLTYFQNNKTLS